MSYARLLTRLYNTPLLLCESKLDILTNEVTLKLLANEPLSKDFQPIEREVPKSKAVVTVFDSLVSRNGAGLSGSTSYESIVSQTKQFITAGHKTIYYYMSSGGGEAEGLFGTAKFINSLPAKYGVETVGIVDGMMCSACYILGSAMGSLKATEDSIIGSLGVLMTTIDLTEADKQDGISYTIIRSRSDKAAGTPHEGETSSSLKHKTNLVKALDLIMVENLAAFRPQVNAALVAKLNGTEVLAREALTLGLIDEIVDSFDLALSSGSSKPSSISLTNTIGTNMTLEELQAENIRLSADLTALKAESQLTLAQGAKEEQTRILGILKSADTLGCTSAMATKRILANSTVEDSTSMFEDIAEAIQLANPLDTNSSADATINPTVVDSAEKTFMQSLEAELKTPTTEEVVKWEVS